MAFLNAEEKQRLRAKIKEAEQKTSGELVTVIARESDPYSYIPLLWAAVVVLAVPVMVVVLGLSWSLSLVSVLQMGLFVVLGLALRWPPVKLLLIPAKVKQRRAARTAREVFLEQGLHHTEGRCGLLLFVSVGERYVEILADKGISDKIKQTQWDAIVADFVKAVKAGRHAEGFEQAVEACGALLAEHFPIQPGDKNELPDHLIEI
ncbi:TPM domain-containing protein [Denitrobaculum tricleocarpae]|uniref:TPM domain-containing protein n=1 Tax=Denitrobaculum tricleocarpae TaxID=2591009 RepID=A0A545T7S9_9PROT|nr:TPM domain-containing protein [Denitrobaculum tricleocarpae]TQV73279.1 hypothetical protein FKG95_24990 [Denitrobaculum tricleocarpae]